MDDSTMTENSDEMEYEEEEEDDDNDYYYSYDNYADSGGDGHTETNDTGLFGNEFETLQGLECLSVEQAKNLLNEHVDSLSSKLHISPSLAKLFLHLNEWNVSAIVQSYMKDTNAFLVLNRVKPATSTLSPSDILSLPSTSTSLPFSSKSQCPVCTHTWTADQFHALTCGHAFCCHCWAKHFEVQINQGITLDISCMASDCRILAPETLILTLLHPTFHDRYESFSFRDFVSTHPCLRFCPGLKCNMVMKARESKPKRATCTACHTSFCFECGIEYHAPTDCAVIKKWLTKCADDSETANYISAHTKDCPKCHICIEKNGGCNHMQCYHCKHEFCWMCLGDWKQHGSEYYECSRYRENPNIGRESALAQAREALKKYLHYYERWENHAKSLKLESALVEKIRTRIASKVMTSSGTWIDWQYLMDAATLLTRCRYTLQYTYPYAYYMQSSSSHSRKELFEYQQAQLEAEIENLSWKVERAETFDRGNLENQMDIAEKRRLTLLKDFHLTSPSSPSPAKDVSNTSSNLREATRDTSSNSSLTPPISSSSSSDASGVSGKGSSHSASSGFGREASSSSQSSAKKEFSCKDRKEKEVKSKGKDRSS